ncbi:hypothetical protein A2348_00700 [Candidatus Uhrbacteria bacterium RIFOXYB12_FULL_58_10]|uniref:Methyltransferase domain-containing protein n=1 Tax=Candidatus Uhrbacteria bacterium RIFOXYB2_FULL_57_15 TaxID=1802422 RepID=A0A1F7W923_9BACT|nr:MAG: hypothetical protein A2348_00700 [Candidatus Uhrbacteria bacterium RIFOXYB12_FULL_58_10]OGL99280.1 MAG: hypothetical protein A2304_04630 [Candidatus Uhrbacteria bacterium RIFOXYB2_FULL_57_15]OGL99933.1 MAG: hypothetical protein A2501_04910 [Candidatus Uhrbacteria bacterium RIFOXYC12_FULL_57_11]
MPVLSSGRALLDAPAILARAGLVSGMHYADYGCGPLGHFVFPASEIVGPEGHVYAVDILKSSLAAIESRIKIEVVNNISVIWGDFERMGGVAVSPDSMHMISVVNIVPVLIRSKNAIEEIRRALRADGMLLLVDWKKEKTVLGPPIEHRVDSTETQLVLARGGFQLKNAFEAGPYHWAQVFVRV